MNDKIDLVVLWVDGNDPAWIEDRQRYEKSTQIDNIGNEANNKSRYRDYDLMEYFFRGIEKNMPWVNNVFFVSYGHLPKCLNTDNPRLKIINHKDYIPKEYLPTFNSNVIELNLHRIPELSENFIIFNDDMFAIDKIPEEMFFVNNVPCDTLTAKVMVDYSWYGMIYNVCFNNMGIINKYFSGNKPFFKWVNLHYGLRDNIANMVHRLYNKYSAFEDQHLPIAHKKSIFETVWSKEEKTLDLMCHNRFRARTDFSHWLMRYWRLASGDFKPFNVKKLGYYTAIPNDYDEIIDILKNKKSKILLLNDGEFESEQLYEDQISHIREQLQILYPEKSSFEK